VVNALHVERATVEDLDRLTPLFDQYRMFYGRPSDAGGAYEYLRARLERDESVVFLASDPDGAAGFTQLYPFFSSVSMASVWVLNDLFVAPAWRRRGVAESLMTAAAQHARETGALRIDLETQAGNVTAQALYAKLGYAEATGFLHYSLTLPQE
jgi:ribosomal protein S18 acetylase RimI-like enzyme